MKTSLLLSLLIWMGISLLPQFSLAQEASAVQTAPPPHLHGKALKAKEESIQIFETPPGVPFQKLSPLWASRSNMESTMKDLRKQAAKLGADGVIDVRVKTEKLRSTDYDPGWWGGPGWGGGFGPSGGYWGGMSYWGGYAQSNTYTQPVVTGWAVKWTGPQPKNAQEPMPQENLEEAVEDAPSAPPQE